MAPTVEDVRNCPSYGMIPLPTPHAPVSSAAVPHQSAKGGDLWSVPLECGSTLAELFATVCQMAGNSRSEASKLRAAVHFVAMCHQVVNICCIF